MTWEFSLPVKIYFGTDKIKELPKIIEEYVREVKGQA